MEKCVIIANEIQRLSEATAYIKNKFDTKLIIWDHTLSDAERNDINECSVCFLYSGKEEWKCFIRKYLSRECTYTNPIIDFVRCFMAGLPVMRVDLMMQNPKVTDYDGMILGISHGQTGILYNFLNGEWCNLCLSHQDIYYNYKTLEYCYDMYADKIRNLKWLIVDMYEYAYINYDCSLSRNIANYWRCGGINFDTHHFQDNQ